MGEVLAGVERRFQHAAISVCREVGHGLYSPFLRTRMNFKIIDRYIGRQLLLTSFFAVVVLSIVLVLGNVFKQVLGLLVTRPDIEMGFVAQFMFYLLLWSLSLTIPWGFLTAILLNFGRLSADNELVSLRMAGLSMPRICMAVFVIMGVLTGFCFWMNLSVSPSAKDKMTNLLPNKLFDMALENPLAMFADEQVMDEIPGHLVYAKKTKDGLENIQIIKMDDSYRPEVFVIANSATLSTEETNGQPEIVMELEDAIFELKSDPDPRNFVEAQPYKAKKAPISISLAKLKEKKDRIRPGDLPLGTLLSYLGRDDFSKGVRTSLITELNLRLSVSMACVTLGLIGIPLGITAQRRETSIGFAMSLIVGLVYFLFIIIAHITREKANLFPYVLAWMPNIIFMTIGFFLFRRACRR